MKHTLMPEGIKVDNWNETYQVWLDRHSLKWLRWWLADQEASYRYYFSRPNGKAVARNIKRTIDDIKAIIEKKSSLAPEEEGHRK